jgi:DNA invertase Pin-like site-specific DNA recombinase
MESSIAILYARSSTSQQEKSVPDQLASLRQWNEVHLGAKVLHEFSDEGVSGSRFKTRPGFQTMIRFCTNGQSFSGEKYVLVESLDRFGRPDDPRQAAAFEWELIEAGWRIVEISEGVKEENEGQEILRTIKRQQAGQYLKDLASKVCRGQHAAMKRGVHIGRPPYGYRIEVCDGSGQVLKVCQRRESPPRGRGYTSRLVIGEPVEVEIVRRIFRDYSQGKGHRLIAKTLNNDGIPSPNGNTWCRGVIPSILKNPVYYGLLVLNRQGSAKFVTIRGSGGEKLSRRPGSEKRRYLLKAKEDWFEIQRPDLAIVSESLFMECRRIAHEKTENRQVIRARSRIVYPAAGVLRCRKCGAVMQGERGKKWSGYRCSSYRRGKGCKQYRVPMKAFHEWLFRLIGDVFRGFPSENEVFSILSEREASHINIEHLEKALKSKKKEAQKMADAVLDSSGILARRARERLEKVEREMESIEVRLQEAQHLSPQSLREKAREIVSKASEVEEILERAKPAEVRQLLMTLGIVFWREFSEDAVTMEVREQASCHNMHSIVGSAAPLT